MASYVISEKAEKINKSRAFELIEKLKQGKELTDIQVDSLLLYFAPPIPKKPKTAFAWVAKAVAKKDVRYYLEYVRVKDGYMYGTDGHRVHKAKTDLAEGWYCPKTGARVECDAKGPDYDRVTGFRSNESKSVKLGDFETLVGKKLTSLYNEEHNVAFNAPYLLEALAATDDRTPFVLDPMNKHLRAVGENQFGTFVIMPTRL